MCLGVCLQAQADTLRDDLIGIQAANSIPHLAVTLIDHDGEMHHLTGNPALPLRWGSITKTVTAVTVIDIARTYHLKLDSKLLDHAPEQWWGNRWRKAHPVTIHQLLELTAGFPDLSGEEFNYAEPVSLEEALELNPDHRATRWPPGLQHVYSNMTAGLSQLFVESVTGDTFDTAVDNTFKRLGMTSASLAPDPDLPGGFRADGITPIPYWHMTFPGYGAMNASSDDIARLLVHLMKRFNENPSHQLFHPATALAARAGLEIGYAAGFYTRIREGRVWHTHGGDADGYRSRLAFLVSSNGRARRGYVVNINTDNPGVLRRIERRIELHLAGLEGEAPKPSDPIMTDATHLEGDYYATGSRFRIKAWQEGSGRSLRLVASPDGKLDVKEGTRSTILVPVTKHLYRRLSDPVATVAFIEHEGSLFLQGELGNYVRTDRCPRYMASVTVCQPTRVVQ